MLSSNFFTAPRISFETHIDDIVKEFLEMSAIVVHCQVPPYNTVLHMWGLFCPNIVYLLFGILL